MNEAQKAQFKHELSQDPQIYFLREKRDKYKDKILVRYPRIEDAEGTAFYKRYHDYGRQLQSLTTTLRKRKEAQVIRNFHEIIDDYNAISSSDFPNRLMVHYEFQERVIIAEMLCLTATG